MTLHPGLAGSPRRCQAAAARGDCWAGLPAWPLLVRLPCRSVQRGRHMFKKGGQRQRHTVRTPCSRIQCPGRCTRAPPAAQLSGLPSSPPVPPPSLHHAMFSHEGEVTEGGPVSVMRVGASQLLFTTAHLPPSTAATPRPVPGCSSPVHQAPAAAARALPATSAATQLQHPPPHAR